MGKKNKKKSKSFLKFLLVFIIIAVFCFGSFMGYSIAKNGGGLQGLLATLLAQDIEELENTEQLTTINILLLRY